MTLLMVALWILSGCVAGALFLFAVRNMAPTIEAGERFALFVCLVFGPIAVVAMLIVVALSAIPDTTRNPFSRRPS